MNYLKRLNGFRFLPSWVHCNGETTKQSAVLHSWHPRQSITWIYAIYWHRHKKTPWSFKVGANGKHAYVVVPLMGTFSVAWQNPMWANK